MTTDNPLKILSIFTKLGLTSFGGPAAHLGFFREEFVVRRKWISDEKYTDLIALCQFLPGPASSQVGLAIGLLRGGGLGAAAAWIGFTIPSVIVLVLAAALLTHIPESISNGAIHGLKLVAVAVVANAVWGMAKKLCDTKIKATIALAAVVVMLLAATSWAQIGCIIAAGIAGRLLFAPGKDTPGGPRNTVDTKSKVGATAGATTDPTGGVTGGRSADGAPTTQPGSTDSSGSTGSSETGPGAGSKIPSKSLVLLALFGGLLVGLPVLASVTSSHEVAMLDAYYRAGALVFGGGHVVLPLLESTTVASGWISREQFLAGYGVTQAVPGPLFTVAAFLGFVDGNAAAPGIGAAVALLAIFLPSFLLVPAAIPLWQQLRSKPGLRAALTGVNAAVVGLLLAALYDPVWTAAVKSAVDVAAIALAWMALVTWKLPPWLVVIVGGIAGALLFT